MKVAYCLLLNVQYWQLGAVKEYLVI